MADHDYMVAKSSTNIWNHTYGKGNVRCTAEIGEEVFRSLSLNWSRWIYVDVMVGSISSNRCKGWTDKKSHETFAEPPSWDKGTERKLKRLNESAFGNWLFQANSCSFGGKFRKQAMFAQI